MIKRIWHGYTTPDRADDYEALLKAEVIEGIEAKAIPGFRKIEVLRRPLDDEVEFVTIMEFDDLDSVKAFVGEDYERAYVPDAAQAILSRFDERSQHYEVEEVRAYEAEPTLSDEIESTAYEATAEYEEPAPAAHAEEAPRAANAEQAAPNYEGPVPAAYVTDSATDPNDVRYETAPIIDAVPVVEPAEESLVSEEPVLAASEEAAQTAVQEAKPEVPVEPAPVLPPGTWFVRSNNGGGSFPVTREGFRVVRNFIFGMLGWGVVGAALSAVGAYQGPPWLVPAGPMVFAAGAALSAIYFISTARKHTDFAITYNDYVKARRNA